MIALIVWFVAWLIGGAPEVAPWNGWFAFLLFASVLSISQGLSNIGQTVVLPAVRVEDEDTHQ